VLLQFSEMHQQQGKSALLTPQQEGWLKIERMMADINLEVCVLHCVHSEAGATGTQLNALSERTCF
jgi:hypothetical protein